MGFYYTTKDKLKFRFEENFTTKDKQNLDAAVPREINHGTRETTFELPPNELHIWGEVTSLNLTIAPADVNYRKEYMFSFISGIQPTTLSLPQVVKWATSSKIEANKTYQVSIVNGIGIMIGV